MKDHAHFIRYIRDLSTGPRREVIVRVSGVTTFLQVPTDDGDICVAIEPALRTALEERHLVSIIPDG